MKRTAKREDAFDREACAARLAPLGFRPRLAFALSCVERMRPNYVLFAAEAGWGDATPIGRALELGWQVLAVAAEPVARSEELSALQDALSAATPDTEDFQVPLVSAALDAAVAARELVAFLSEGALAAVVEIASLCVDTVDLHVQELEDIPAGTDDLERRVVRHPLMQQELRRQRADLAAVKRCRWGRQAVATLERAWARPRKSNLRLSPSAPRTRSSGRRA